MCCVEDRDPPPLCPELEGLTIWSEGRVKAGALRQEGAWHTQEAFRRSEWLWSSEQRRAAPDKVGKGDRGPLPTGMERRLWAKESHTLTGIFLKRFI